MNVMPSTITTNIHNKKKKKKKKKKKEKKRKEKKGDSLDVACT